MSWKKVLRAARRLGTPVIIADEMGDDPFVVMTLSKYEDLMDENEMLDLMVEDDDEPLELDESDFEDEPEDFSGSMDPRLEKVFEEQFVTGMQDLAKEKQKFTENPSVEPFPEVQESPKTKEEMPLEDRFYFEPLDDEFKK